MKSRLKILRFSFLQESLYLLNALLSLISVHKVVFFLPVVSVTAFIGDTKAVLLRISEEMPFAHFLHRTWRAYGFK